MRGIWLSLPHRPELFGREYIEGATLAERIKEGPIPLEEALTIAKQIADALEAAHEKSIVHRDLKPANIKIRPDGSVKVLDFGLAKAGETREVTPDSPTMVPSTVSQQPTYAHLDLFGRVSEPCHHPTM
jgi:serine/threonine-protein kinase